MKIQRIEAYAARYTAATSSFVMSGGRTVSGIEATVVKVVTDDGVIGWGEQSPFPGYMVADPGTCRAALAVLGGALIGEDPTRPKRVQQVMRQHLKGNHATRSMVDIACWDIIGKSRDAPVSALTGGILHHEIPVIRAIGIGSPEAMRDSMAALVTEGYDRVQVKLGDDWRIDAKRATACLEAAGESTTVVFDANGNWRPDEAVRFAAAIGGPQFIEQPCDRVAQCLSVRERSNCLLILDESLATVTATLPLVTRYGIDAAMLKMSRFGGVTPTLLVRDVCERMGVPVIIEDGGAGDILAAASAQLAASTDPKWLFSGSLTNVIINERIVSGAPRHVNGRALVPTGPGLGLGDVDEEFLGEPIMSIS